MTETEFNYYKNRILAQAKGNNVHKVHNLLAAMETSVKEYNQTKDYRWLRIAGQAKISIQRTLNG